MTRLPLSRVEVVQKRLFDLIFAAAALIALTPLIIVVAILIKLDSPGPIFFVQRRWRISRSTIHAAGSCCSMPRRSPG